MKKYTVLLNYYQSLYNHFTAYCQNKNIINTKTKTIVNFNSNFKNISAKFTDEKDKIFKFKDTNITIDYKFHLYIFITKNWFTYKIYDINSRLEQIIYSGLIKDISKTNLKNVKDNIDSINNFLSFAY